MNYKSEYKKYLTSAVLDNANNKIASTSFISAFAIYLGLSDIAIGIYAILNTITNMLQIFAAPLFSRIGQSKKVVLTNYTIYRISSVAFAFIPFLSNDIGTTTFLFFLFAGIYAITGQLGYITFLNWRMTLLKKEDRTKFTATKNIFKNTIVMAFSLMMGVLLDTFTKSGNELYGFIILFLLVFIIAFVDIAIRIKTYKPDIQIEPINIKKSIELPAKDKEFRKTVITAGIMKFSFNIGTMFLNVFLLRYLNIDYIYYSILNILICLSEAMSARVWDKRSMARNWNKVIIPMIIIFVIAFSALFGLENNIIIYILPIIYIALGIANGAWDMFDNVAIYENSKEGFQTSYVTFQRFIEGLVTALIPILAYTIFRESDSIIKITFLIAIIGYIALFIYFKKSFKNKLQS